LLGREAKTGKYFIEGKKVSKEKSLEKENF